MQDSVIIVGVDPSTKKIALVWTYDDDTASPGTWVYKLPDSQDYAKRCGTAFEATTKQLRKITQENPMAEVYVFIEEPVVGRGGAYATISQSKLHGAIVAACQVSGVVTQTRGVNNQTAKKQVVGKGNAGKPEIRTWVRLYWRKLEEQINGYNKGDQQDVADAGMINRYGHKVVATQERLRNYRSKKPIRRRVRKK